MTNEEKAKEIQSNDVCCVWNGGCPNVYYAAMKMAEWKEQQMIEKACDLYREELIQFNNLLSHLNSDYAGLVDVEKSYKDFKNAMKGGEE